MISAKPANDSSVERRTFALLLSETEITITISSTFAASARSAPRGLATSATYFTFGLRLIPAITASASASAGTAFGETNEVTSILWRPLGQRVDDRDLRRGRDEARLDLEAVAGDDLVDVEAGHG